MKIVACALFCTLSLYGFSQSPGQIVRPAGGVGVTVLNPNGNSYASATIAGFSSNDITESEVPFHIVPPAIIEPTGDLATGPSGGFTDIVRSVDGSGFYIYADGTNILFRLRIGNIISGSKGYSVLLDVDGKMGNSGPNADPDYTAPTNTTNGNPGFEYEVVLETNFQVAVFNINGTGNPGSPVATYTLNSNSQISAALSTDSNNPDYFYDWYVPLSAVGAPVSLRIAATTVSSPSSALQGSRSDIYGIDDATSGVANAWSTVVNAQPIITIASISSGGSGVGAVCTAPPALNSSIITGSNISVSGTWTRLDVSKPSNATITLYKNGTSVSTALVNSGSTWTITVPSIAAGDKFMAKALASGESQCLESNNITAGCSATPASPSISCASTKGITGTLPLGVTVNIYQVTTANSLPTTTQLSSGLVYTNNVADQTFNYFATNPQSGNACQGQNSILTSNTTYMLVSNNNGCLSAPTFICITGASQNSWNLISSNMISLITPVYPYQTTINGSGVTSGQLLRLFINDQYVKSITATGNTFNFSSLVLQTGDAIKIYAQTSGACMTVSAAFLVSCYTQPPALITNSSGNLLTSATSIGGTSVSPGATINLSKGISPSGVSIGTATANSSGAWTVNGLSLAVNEIYYATITTGGCTSPSSAAATVLGQTNICPAFGSAAYPDNITMLSGSITTFSGTIRVYLDGTLIGSAALTTATTWSIPVNTTFSNTLYAGGILTVTSQSTGNAESSTCNSSASISCMSPSQPAITPTSASINTGQNITFTVSNVVSNTWYAIMDNLGISYATSMYSQNTNNLSLSTKTFNTPGTYNVSVSADKLTGCAISYQLASILVTAVALPVHFLNLTVKKDVNQVKISWSVSSEQNIGHYLVERSTDCQTFLTVGTVEFNASSSFTKNYSYSDTKLPNTERLCYRIKQVDRDARYTYSNIAAISNIQEDEFKISPNPAKEKISIFFSSSKEQRCLVELIDLNGKTFFHKSYSLNRDANKLEVNNLNTFPSGSYFIKISAGKYTGYKKLIIR